MQAGSISPPVIGAIVDSNRSGATIQTALLIAVCFSYLSATVVFFAIAFGRLPRRWCKVRKRKHSHSEDEGANPRLPDTGHDDSEEDDSLMMIQPEQENFPSMSSLSRL